MSRARAHNCARDITSNAHKSRVFARANLFLFSLTDSTFKKHTFRCRIVAAEHARPIQKLAHIRPVKKKPLKNTSANNKDTKTQFLIICVCVVGAMDTIIMRINTMDPGAR